MASRRPRESAIARLWRKHRCGRHVRAIYANDMDVAHAPFTPQPLVLCHPSGFVLPANQGRVKFNRRPGSLWFAGYTDYNVGLLGLGDHAWVIRQCQIDVLIPSFVSTNSTAGRRHVRRRLFAAEDFLTMQVARFTRLKRRSIPSRQW